MKEINIAIVGSREFADINLLVQAVDDYCTKTDSVITKVISGGARGADYLAEVFAISRGIPTKIHYPDWHTYGKKAGFIRNELIVDDADVVFAFWDGESRGTASSIKLARQKNKELVVIRY